GWPQIMRPRGLSAISSGVQATYQAFLGNIIGLLAGAQANARPGLLFEIIFSTLNVQVYPIFSDRNDISVLTLRPCRKQGFQQRHRPAPAWPPSEEPGSGGCSRPPASAAVP